MEEDLYKIRSLAKCIQAAYELLSTNLKKIIKRTWLPAVVFSVIAAVTHLLLIENSDITNIADAPSLNHATWTLGTLGTAILSFVAMMWGFTHVISLLNGKSFKTNWPRMIKLFALLFGVTVVLTAIIMALGYLPLMSLKAPPTPTSIALMTGTMMLGFVIATLCLIPAYYSVMKYCMEPEQKLGIVFGKHYRKGWRHWGFLFMLVLLVSIILCIFSIIVITPILIIQMACFMNTHGMSMGDASGIPSYYPWLAFATTLLCTFIWFYIMTWEIMVFYYAYGTIEAKIDVKNQISTITAGHEGADFPEIS